MLCPIVVHLIIPEFFVREQAEGIFRINAENSEEELVREQLNRGIVPDGIDVHCLAGLIKVLQTYLIYFTLRECTEKLLML